MFGKQNTLKIEGTRISTAGASIKEIELLNGARGRQIQANVLFHVAMRNLDAPGVKKATEMGAKTNTNIRFYYEDNLRFYFDGERGVIHPPLRVALENDRPDIFESVFRSGARTCWRTMPVNRHLSDGSLVRSLRNDLYDIIEFAAKHHLGHILATLKQELHPNWAEAIDAYVATYSKLITKSLFVYHLYSDLKRCRKRLVEHPKDSAAYLAGLEDAAKELSEKYGSKDDVAAIINGVIRSVEKTLTIVIPIGVATLVTGFIGLAANYGLELLNLVTLSVNAIVIFPIVIGFTKLSRLLTRIKNEYGKLADNVRLADEAVQKSKSHTG